MTLLFHLPAQDQHLVIRVRELVVAGLFRPVRPVDDGDGDDAPRHRLPNLVHDADVFGGVGPAIELLPQRLGDVPHVDEGLVVQVRAVAPGGDDVAGSAFDRRRGLGRQVRLVDELEDDLHALLFRVLLGLLAQGVVHCVQGVGPRQDVDPGRAQTAPDERPEGQGGRRARGHSDKPPSADGALSALWCRYRLRVSHSLHLLPC